MWGFENQLLANVRELSEKKKKNHSSNANNVYSTLIALCMDGGNVFSMGGYETNC